MEEALYSCSVRSHRVVSAAPVAGEAPDGQHEVEVEVMDKHRSYGFTGGKLVDGRLLVEDRSGILGHLPDGQYTCVAYYVLLRAKARNI